MTYITDLRDYLDDDEFIAPKGGPAQRVATFLAGIVGWATAFEMEAEEKMSWLLTNVFCSQHGRSDCPGQIQASAPVDGLILWRCDVCEDDGEISGWEDGMWDRVDGVGDDPVEDLMFPVLMDHEPASLQEELGASNEEFALALALTAEGLEDQGMRASLAQRAIEIWPDCVEGYLVLAESGYESDAHRLELLWTALEIAEREIGKEAFEAARGTFWAVEETRPYMDAKLQLASCLWGYGEADAALDHLEEMLELNPMDHQGARFHRMQYLAVLERFEDLDELLARYPEDTVPDTAYWRLLRGIMTMKDDAAGVAALLAAALECNSYVPDFLLERNVEFVEDEDKVEDEQLMDGVNYAARARSVWLRTPGALRWLMRQTP